MQGAGTQENPFLIETWTDLFEIARNPNVFARLVQDLDGNDFNDGVFPATTFPQNLDGGGHTIRNLYNMVITDSALIQPYGNSRKSWKNIIFENILTTAPIFGGYSNTLTLENCKITASARSLAWMGCDFIGCTLSLEMMGGIAEGVSASFTRCDINAKIDRSKMADGVQLYYGIIGTRLDTTRIVAEIAQPLTGSPEETVSVSNSVLALKMDDSSKAIILNGNASAPSVVDSTLWGDAEKNDGAGILRLTTAEMKNADALNAAGFPVVRIA